VGAALAEAGAREVTLYNRTLARAEAAAQFIAARFPGTNFDARPLLPAAFDRPFDLVINCTSGEGAEAVAALSLAALPRTATWTDTNYWMADPPQLTTCAARGIRIQRGIGMLVHQGARSFERFTGVAVNPDAVRGVLDLGGW
jgi:shikimate dehydrogenase